MRKTEENEVAELLYPVFEEWLRESKLDRNMFFAYADARNFTVEHCDGGIGLFYINKYGDKSQLGVSISKEEGKVSYLFVAFLCSLLDSKNRIQFSDTTHINAYNVFENETIEKGEFPDD